MKSKNDTKALHPRNLHNQRYDFDELIKALPELIEYVKENKYNDLSIDFSNSEAVLLLNKALLKHFYQVDWEIPKKYLCPPIPGRVDYIHYLADLLCESNNGEIPKGKDVKALDIGVGANCIYPLVGHKSYGWRFVGSDIEEVAIKSARNIIELNDLNDNIEIRQQSSYENIFENIIYQGDRFDFTMCNPPFHSSKKDAREGSLRKIKNLSKCKNKKVTLNFGGQHNELWCQGGELEFIKRMLSESIEFKNNVLWFTSLVSKKENLNEIYKELENTKVSEYKTIEMQQGNKVTRIVAWSFFNKKQRKNWY